MERMSSAYKSLLPENDLTSKALTYATLLHAPHNDSKQQRCTFKKQHVEMSFWIVFILSCWLLININKTNQNIRVRWASAAQICLLGATKCMMWLEQCAMHLMRLNFLGWTRVNYSIHLSLLLCVYFFPPFLQSEEFLIVFCIVDHIHCFKIVNFCQQIIWLKQIYYVISDGKLWRLWLPASC